MSEIDALQAFLAAHPAPYAKQFDDLVRHADEAVAETQRARTIAQRKQAWLDAVATFDVEKLVELQGKMQGYVDKMVRIESAEPRALTAEEVVALGAEYVDYLDIAEFLAVRKDTIRDYVYAHLDETVGEDRSGEIPVPEVGKVFKREGCGRTTPGVDVDRLRELLGADYEQCLEVTEVPEQVIPAHTEVAFSEEKLMALAARKPEVLEALRQSLIPGQRKTPRFVVRPYKEKKENR